MKFEISHPADRSPGLKVIPLIPDFDLVHLEGTNGIGKTVASRLLELATGGKPYADAPYAWRTLKRQLGRTVITVSGLSGGHSLVFDLDPNSWLDEPGIDERHSLGSVLLDGHDISWADARRLLAVRRISGDESLIQTLAREVAEWSVDAFGVERDVRETANDYEEQLSALRSMIGNVSRESLTTAAAGVLHADKQLQDHRIAFTAVSNAAADAAAAVAGTRDMLSRRSLLARLLHELESTGASVEAARDAMGAAEVAASAAAAVLTANNTISAEIATWEHRRTLRTRAVQRAVMDEKQIIASLDLGGTPDPLELERLIADVRSEERNAVDRRNAVDLVQPLKSLLSEVQTPLEQRAPQLGAERVANLQTSLSVSQLLTGVRDRRAELDGQPRVGELAELDRAVTNADRRRRLLTRLSAAQSVTTRKRSNLQDAEQHLTRLYAKTPQTARAQFEQAQTDSEAAREKLIAAELAKREVHKHLAEILDEVPAVEDEDTHTASGGHDGTTQPWSQSEAAVEHSPDDEDDDNEDAEVGAASLYPEFSVQQAQSRARMLDDQVGIAIASVSRTASDRLLEDDVVALDRLLALARESSEQLTNEDDQAALEQITQLSARLDVAEREVSEQARYLRDDVATARLRLAELRARTLDSYRSLIVPNGDWTEWADASQLIFERLECAAPQSISLEKELSNDELLIADGLAAVDAVAYAASEAAQSVPSDLAGLGGYLRAQSARLWPQAVSSDGNGVRSEDLYAGNPATQRALTQWIQTSLTEYLTSPTLTKELFDGAQDVTLQLEDMSILWTLADGGIRKRPLEAFSSGEQVFAYTRANLARINESRIDGQQVVVFLDEFGAFVARDRLGQLMQFVESREVHGIADQVIVMLPLSRDYSVDEQPDDALRENAIDSLTLRGQQVAERGYFAVPFSSSRAELV